ncbi:MAG: beta-lactamase family protein [Planctomycetes bacterium]|nr:beta-lactamase family protein [Planctomycetota bacterium]
MTRFRVRSDLLGATAALALAATAATQSCNGFAGFTSVVQSAIQNLSLTGMIARVDQHGQNVLLQTYSGWPVTAPTPLASASKPLAVAVALSLVDQNLLQLDAPIGTWLPEWATGPHAAVTLRMCLAHTSGIVAFHPATTNPNITMRQAAMQIAQVPLDFTPGTAFQYGNVSIQVAGAACEVVSGLPWHQLFQQQIAGPLGMTATNFYVNGINQNPGIAEAAQSSAQDYALFLEMLRRRGLAGTTRVLSEAAVDEMLTDQVGSLPVLWTPHPLAKPYGLGLILERKDALGRTTLASAPGAYAFFGWLDLEHDSIGVWLSITYFILAYPYVLDAWDELDVALAPIGVTCVGTGSPACATAPQLFADGWPRDGQPDFQLRVAAAPASAFGALSFEFGGPSPGFAIADLVSYIAAPVSLIPLPTDAQGDGALPLPIPSGMQGLPFTMQGAWVDLGGCGQLGVVGSHALHVTVLAP